MDLLKNIPSELLLIIIEYLSVPDLADLYITDPLYYGKYIVSKDKDFNANVRHKIIELLKSMLCGDKILKIMNHVNSGGYVYFYSTDFIESINMITTRLKIKYGPFVNSVNNFKIYSVDSGVVLVASSGHDRFTINTGEESTMFKYLVENDIDLELK
jgi:hypothetical protein